MNGLLSSIYHHVDPYDNFIQSSAIRTTTTFQPVKIAILDSGFNPGNPLLLTDTGQLDPRIKGVRNFVDHTNPDDIQDDIGHGTHTLGLLLKVATCADIYIARIASGDCLTRNSYESIAKARLASYFLKVCSRANIKIGYQPCGHRMECRHHIDVIWNS